MNYWAFILFDIQSESVYINKKVGGMDTKIISKLKELVGADNFFDSPEEKMVYAFDGTPLISNTPVAILRPNSANEVAQILKMANEDGFAVVPRGSGTGLSGGAIPAENSITLLFNHWDKILEVDSDNLTAWVQPGVVTAKIHRAVENQGLFYPPDPGSQEICTIGGNVAENAGGLRGLKYGVTKNYIMGIEMVLPNGELIVNGGKNVKDVAGYNLRDLIIGSEGTLGIFTRLLLKLIPKPESSQTLLAYFNKLTDAADTVSEIIANHIIPCTVEFLDNTTIQAVESYAKLGLPKDIDALLLLEVDGHEEVVKRDVETIRNICLRKGAREIKIARDENEALKLTTARRAAFASLARIKPTTILEDATVPRSNLAVLVEKIDQVSKKYN